MIALAESDAGSRSLLEWVETTYSRKPEVAGGSPLTARYYLIEARKLDRYFRGTMQDAGQTDREMLVSDLSDTIITGAMAEMLEAGRARATCNKLKRAAVAFWNLAHSQGMLDYPPKIGVFREPKRDPEAWWDHEFERILRAATRLPGNLGDVSLSDWFECLLRVVFNSGSRISAAMAIETDWLDLPSKRLVISADVQKDDEDQTVILLPGTVETIQRLEPKRLRRLFDDWPYDRHSEQWSALNYLLRKVIVMAGLRGDDELRAAVERGGYRYNGHDLRTELKAAVSRRHLWHKIRRTFATLITAKSDIETARSMLGHSTIDVTKRYVDPTKIGRKSQADLLDDPLPHGLRIWTPADQA